MATLIVPAEVVERLREHAVEVNRERPGFESVGCFVLDGDTAIRYARLRNWSRRPNEFQVMNGSRLSRRVHPTLVVHSHPVSPATPSADDIAGATGDMAAIYSLPEDRLTVWRTGSAWTEISVEIVSN